MIFHLINCYFEILKMIFHLKFALARLIYFEICCLDFERRDIRHRLSSKRDLVGICRSLAFLKKACWGWVGGNEGYVWGLRYKKSIFKTNALMVFVVSMNAKIRNTYKPSYSNINFTAFGWMGLGEWDRGKNLWCPRGCCRCMETL